MSAQVVPLRPTYGATADEWATFALVVGCADLLPVVSRPGAVISSASTMKGLGKTPSVYNRNRQVVGMPKWTELQTTDAQIEKWSQESDYGLCIQTRRVRGLDIDIADPDLSDRVAAAFTEALEVAGHTFPRRVREATGKQLLAFELVGQFPKRSFKVDGGLVEFLGNGQQFIALGEHFDGQGQPTGTRYAWGDALPMAFPRVTTEQFEAAWASIVELFALGPASESEAAQARDRADIDGLQDPVAEYLDEKGLVIGQQGEKLFVHCPWKEGHTSDSGISETAWLVAGSKGFERGHFQCMHASCAKREDVDFLDAIGFRVAAFRDLTRVDPNAEDGDAEPRATNAIGADDDVPPPWPKFKRDGKMVILPTLDNVQLALARPDLIGLEIRFDTFRDELMVVDQGRPFEDADAVAVRIELEKRGFRPVGKELARDALLKHGRDNRFDSAQEWLETLPGWDGVDRVGTAFPRLFKTQDNPYTRAVGLYVFTALAGRIMDPGCKADMVPILQGEQGDLKSWAIKALAPEPEMFREINLEKIGHPDLSRRLRGCVVGELAELRGLRTRDAETIKAWIVEQDERWVPKFQEREITFPRRCVFFATANPHELLDDETGERRWLPMAVQSSISVAAIAAERDQLWAEGLVRWQLDGIAWREAERLGKAEHEAFKVRDGWSDLVARWLDQAVDVSRVTYNERGWVLLSEVASGALDVRAASLTRPIEARIGKVLRSLGWKSQGVRIDGKAAWGWVKQDVRDA